ncbi:unnamed protein product [Amoebophrya sp. A120]|nr:unnamed protein product [Amoebophrya sp. A120]|eukprot:GSA120T00011305001.1
MAGTLLGGLNAVAIRNTNNDVARLRDDIDEEVGEMRDRMEDVERVQGETTTELVELRAEVASLREKKQLQDAVIVALEGRLSALENRQERHEGRFDDLRADHGQELRLLRRDFNVLKSRVQTLSALRHQRDMAEKRLNLGGTTEAWRATFGDRARSYMEEQFSMAFTKNKISTELENIKDKPRLWRIAKEVTPGRNIAAEYEKTNCKMIRDHIRKQIGFRGMDHVNQAPCVLLLLECCQPAHRHHMNECWKRNSTPGAEMNMLQETTAFVIEQVDLAYLLSLQHQF